MKKKYFMNENIKALFKLNHGSIEYHDTSLIEYALLLNKENEYKKLKKVLDDLVICPFKGMYLNDTIYKEKKRFCRDVDLIIPLNSCLTVNRLMKSNKYKRNMTFANLLRWQITYKKNNEEFDIHYFYRNVFFKRNRVYNTKARNERLALNLFLIIENCIRDLVFDEKRKKDIGNICILLGEKELCKYVKKFNMQKKIDIYISAINNNLDKRYYWFFKAKDKKGIIRILYKAIQRFF